MIAIDSSIFRFKGNDLVVFLYLLTHADENGVCDTSYGILSHELGISVQSLRTIILRLRATNEIVFCPTNKITHITLCNYGSYVISDGAVQQANSILPNKQISKETLPKTKEEIAAKMEKDKNRFYQSLVKYVDTYGKAMVREFFDYWTETNVSNTRMKFQLERTWDTSKRLARWASNDNHKNGKNYGRETITDKIKRTVEEANAFSEQLKERIGTQTELDFGDNPEVW